MTPVSGSTFDIIATTDHLLEKESIIKPPKGNGWQLFGFSATHHGAIFLWRRGKKE